MSDISCPKELDAIVDKVLSYRPKPKTKVAKARKRRSARLSKQSKTTGGTGRV
jgi:hypothetical protein